MHHRHLAHDRLTAAAIDAMIRRGGWRDWVELRRAVLGDVSVRETVARLSRAYLRDPEAEGRQRMAFWNHYVERLGTTVG